MMFGLSGFSDAHSACSLLFLRRPLIHCGGKHSRKVLEKSDLKGKSVQAAFVLHTATSEAGNDPCWL